MTARALRIAASPTPPCVAYTRVSKEEQARDDRASLGQQRGAVAALAVRFGVAVGDVFEDAGRSGGTANRPAFQALLRHCEQNRQPAARPGLVLVLNDSRWGRFEDPEEATYWRVHLSKLGWTVRFAEGDDIEDRTARGVMRSIGSSTSSQYRENIKRNAKRGARGTAERGFWCNEAPLGYRRATVGGGRPGTVLDVGQRKTDDEHVTLVPGPATERAAIRHMFERYDSGEASLGVLVGELEARWPGLRVWSRPVVRQMLANPAYAGDVVWMVRSNGPRDGDPVVVRDAIAKPLVERSLWDRVQARLARRRHTTVHTAGGYPLRGLLTCSDCGAPYMGAGGPKNHKNPADPDRYRFYRENGTAPGRCGDRQGTLQKRVVEPLVVAEVAKVVADPNVQRLIAKELDGLLRAAPDTKRALDKERTDLEAQRRRIVERIGRGLITDEDAAPVLADVRGRLDALAAEGERAAFAAANRKAAAAERDRLLAMARDFAARAKGLSGAALRELLRPWLAGAVVDKRARTVTLAVRRVPFIPAEGSPGRD